nr:syn-copalyl diphosphate [Scutellaria barbata]
MYSTLSTLPPNFLTGKKVFSPENGKRKWKTQSKGVPWTCFVRYRDKSNDARQGRMDMVHVFLQNESLIESEPLTQVVKEMNYGCKSKIEECREYIKEMLGSMDDGRITVSPYDTAWVALIRDIEGRNIPQFPSSLDWISNNQLSDGSWGDQHLFLSYDRLLNTLACVVALRYWNLAADKTEKGISFIKENISRLGDADVEHMTCGFELVFPALLQKAKELGIHGIPYDAPVLRDILAARDRKMERVPKELLYKEPTCLLHNLEGLENVEMIGKLEWPKLLNLQTPKGSYITSPAASAFAVIHTNNQNCLQFINYVVNKFNGGAPTVYPVDIYARLWAVDRLHRLGISRFFEPEIRSCLDHVYRFWTDKGVFSARESEFCDIDDTSMGFRLLRLHGYKISPNALKHFKKDNNFTCYVGQGFESPSPIFNLYRASQVLYPGETILEEAKEFSYNFLSQRLEKNDLLDKWLISKHLPDEIKCGLEIPWYASLSRVEARLYIENYGVDDIWIGKSLYRMPEINDPVYLELAKLDYNRCQTQHQMEWAHVQHWFEDSGLKEFGISKKELLLAFYLAAASIFEPERSEERLAWLKTQIMCDIISTMFSIEEADFPGQTNEASNKSENKQYSKGGHHQKSIQSSIPIFFIALHKLMTDANKRIGSDSSNLLLNVWQIWLMKHVEGNDAIHEAELLVDTINICGGHIVSEGILSQNEYKTLSGLTSKICHQLGEIEKGNEKLMAVARKKREIRKNIYREIDKDMQLLVQLVLEDSSSGISKDIKQTFLMVAKTFYYRAYFPTQQIESHMSKILFRQVV